MTQENHVLEWLEAYLDGELKGGRLHQVEAHLQDHLERLPDGDARSQAILDQMKVDEAKHADMAEAAGARSLPEPIRRAMAITAGFMKTLAYRL